MPLSRKLMSGALEEPILDYWMELRALLEAKLGNGASCLACRHHMHEIMLEKFFSSCLAPSSAPGIKVLKRFKEIWPNVRHSNFSSGIRDDTVLTELDSETHEMITVMCIWTARYGAPQRWLLRWVLVCFAVVNILVICYKCIITMFLFLLFSILRHAIN